MDKKRYTKNKNKIDSKNMIQDKIDRQTENFYQSELVSDNIYEVKFYNENLPSKDIKRVFIEYNPYIPSTKITVEKQTPKKNSNLNIGEHRLQEWIDNLPSILSDEYLSKNFKIGFHGTIADYDDLLETVQEATKRNIKIDTIHYPATEVNDKENLIKEIFKKIQDGPFDKLKDKNESLYDAFNKFKNREFEVNIVATMSSGKSTLINSLLSTKLMPAKNTSCTQVITKIKDIKNKDNNCNVFTAKVYDKNWHEVENCDNLTLQKMKELNANKDVSEIHIEGKIPFVVSDDITLILVDTPGPNSAKNENHKTITENILSRSAKQLIMYILDAEQFRTTDDSKFLEYVAKSIGNEGKKSRDRFIFVLNKIDELKQNEDNVKEILNEAKEYLKEKGIKNPNIYPASALTALNIRTILSNNNGNEYSIKEKEANLKVEKFNTIEEMHLEKYVSLPLSVKNQIEKNLEEAKINKDMNKQALIHCGIIPLEEAIKTYVYKYAKPIRIRSIFENFEQNISSYKYEANLKKDCIENENKREKVLKDISKINDKMKSGEDAKKFKQIIDKINIDDEIDDGFNKIAKEGEKEITLLLGSFPKAKIEINEAKPIINNFKSKSSLIGERLEVSFKDLVNENVIKYSEKLLEQYKNKLKDLNSDINTKEKMELSPFNIMRGSISSFSVDDIINNTKERIKTGSERRTKKKQGLEHITKVAKTWNPFSKNFWSRDNWNFTDEIEWYEDVYGDFIDKEKFTQKVTARIQKSIFDIGKRLEEYTQNQVQEIKEYFYKEFDKLDDVLKQKLEEYKNFISDRANIEEKIKRLEENLAWLNQIQKEVSSIVEL